MFILQIDQNDIQSNIKSLQEKYLSLNKDFKQLQNLGNKNNENLAHSMSTYSKLKNNISSEFDIIDQLIKNIENSPLKESYEVK